MTGKLIVFEGISCSGKSTQIKLLKNRLEKEGYSVVTTKWKSDEIIEQTIQKVKEKRSFTPLTYSLLHCLDFAKRYKELILPALQEGKIVIADRYKYTAFTRDVVRGVDIDYVRGLFSFAVTPDYTFYIDLDPKEALKRRLNRHPKLYFHSSGGDLNLSTNLEESFLKYQELLTRAYKNIAEYDDFIIIDGKLEKDSISNLIWNTTLNNLGS